jgi:hypothetical protein
VSGRIDYTMPPLAHTLADSVIVDSQKAGAHSGAYSGAYSGGIGETKTEEEDEEWDSSEEGAEEASMWEGESWAVSESDTIGYEVVRMGGGHVTRLDLPVTAHVHDACALLTARIGIPADELCLVSLACPEVLDPLALLAGCTSEEELEGDTRLLYMLQVPREKAAALHLHELWPVYEQRQQAWDSRHRRPAPVVSMAPIREEEEKAVRRLRQYRKQPIRASISCQCKDCRQSSFDSRSETDGLNGRGGGYLRGDFVPCRGARW